MAVEHSNVIMAITGASAALAGFTLVFVGSLISTHQSFEADTSSSVTAKYKHAIWVAIAAFVLDVLGIGGSVWWLSMLHDVSWLYVTVGWVFVAQLLATLATATFGVYRLVR